MLTTAANPTRGASVSTRMAMVLLSGGRCFDPETGEVVVGHRVTRLELQPAALLALLVSRPGELVTREEIHRRLWADGRHVDYAAGLHYAVRQIRRALGDDGRDVETLPRRGYRLRAAALRPAERPPRSSMALDPATMAASSRRRAVAAWLLALAASCALVALVERRPNNHHARVVTLLQAVHDALY